MLCFSKGWSSEDFLSLNNKDNLTNGLETATKNDSRAEFFGIRTSAFEIVTQKVKDMFKSIKCLTVTLDKVTVNRTSYTVIMTYFFWNGTIHIILNKLVKLSTSEYDGPGTANMVINCVTETLGLTKTQLANRLVHFCYDGVYASDEQRVCGGGSLSLSKHVCQQLGLRENSISGDWDASHNMQLVFSDVMKGNPIIMKTMKLLFDAMKEYNVGKGKWLSKFFLKKR